jgi:hypothetical protein
MASTYTEVRTLLSNMSFTPDVPSGALGATEYNSGQNIETDTRGMRAVFGDLEILGSIPGDAGPAGQAIFLTAGYRESNAWEYIVCVLTNSNEGRWYAIKPSGIENITPGYGASSTAYLPGYYADMPITDTWNGTTLLLNDSVTAPMYLTSNGAELQLYSQNSVDLITTATAGDGVHATLTFDTQATAPYTVGQQIVVSGITPTTYNGIWTVTNCTTTTVTYAATATGNQTLAGVIAPQYQWNYTPGWTSVTAGFMRMFSTPNVGSIMIAGNLTATLNNSTVQNYPATVQWSQSFGLNGIPTTWAPTTTNIANQLEVPVRGPVIDGFPANGNFYVCSYWDTVVFSPISYQGTNYPVLGVRLLNQGRGLLNENCWANADTMVYGLDARDIWVFDGNNFKSLGNQRVKNYFYKNLNNVYYDRTFMVNNTEKNQIEIYYPDLNSTGWCNKVLTYRYDLDCWNAPRDIDTTSHAVEAPTYVNNVYNKATRTVTYSRAVTASKLVEKDQGTSFLGGAAITSQFQRDNIQLGLKYSQQALMHRVLPETYNIDTAGLPIAQGVGNVTVSIGGSDAVGQAATFTPASSLAINSSNPWIQANQNAYRVYSLNLLNSSATDTWQATAVSWQFTATEDDR